MKTNTQLLLGVTIQLLVFFLIAIFAAPRDYLLANMLGLICAMLFHTSLYTAWLIKRRLSKRPSYGHYPSAKPFFGVQMNTKPIDRQPIENSVSASQNLRKRSQPMRKTN